MKKEPIINVDWLQFFVDLGEYRVPCEGEERVLSVKARTFAEVVDIYLHGHKVGQICRKPYSTIINPKCGTFKVENVILYANNATAIIENVLTSFGINPLSVTRVDLCGDFETIGGRPPSQMIKDLINGVLLKVGHSKLYLHGEDAWTIKGIRKIGEKTWVATNQFECVGESSSNKLDYLRYGTNNSNVVCYLYNKSKELREVKDKPYVRQRWGNVSGDVWRLEFSVKGRRLSFIEKESGLVLCGDWHEYFKDTIRLYYSGLCCHYFDIRENTGQVRKDREKKVVLFNGVGDSCYVADLSVVRPSNKADRVFIRRLHEEMCEAYNFGDVETAERYRMIGRKFMIDRDLRKWCYERGYYFEERSQVVQSCMEFVV